MKFRERLALAINPKMSAGDALFDRLAFHLAAQEANTDLVLDNSFYAGGYRNQFMRYPPLFSTVTFISSIVAQLCEGVTVRNREDNIVENERTMAILRMIAHSPDNGITPSYQFIQDCMLDYLLDGNAIIVPVMERGRIPVMLERYRPNGAYTYDPGDGGPLIYQIQKALSRQGTQYQVQANRVIHARWGHTESDRVGAGHRQWFAPSPIALFSRNFMLGLAEIMYVEKRIKKAPTSLLAFMYNDEKLQPRTPEQVEEIKQQLKSMSDNSIMAVTGATIQQIDSSPVHEQILSAKKQMAQSIGMIYRLHPALVTGDTGQWARGVTEQVMKMIWRVCIHQHFNALMSAIGNRLLLPHERFHVDPVEFVRGDAAGIAELVKAVSGDAQKNPAASREEIRHMVGLPRQVDGVIENTMSTDMDMMNPENPQ